ncbi:hypothetical protein HPP92_018186 [Vanilla planifolia]|uniref:ubiquitinyl hydrolase 1 n=1 Tax=Vanilla planifolia TaxID=51239 RepID=A0A835Q9F3_VANPL|nr:hypothetical protein HPP92_018186 [Vanilla planifolia]
MECPSNGGLLYHEVQEAKLCAVHCVNTVLQGPFFSEVDLAALASDLDQKERQMMLDGSGVFPGDFFSDGSYNVSMGGDFSIQVLQKALEVWDMQVIPMDSPSAEASKYDPELENAFICHLLDHWFCIRKGSGWSIFIVRGSFPKECPITANDATNGFGQWLTPDDAKRITASCQHSNLSSISEPSSPSEADAIASQEEQDLRAAIAASLVDFSAICDGTSSLIGNGSCSVDSNTVNSASNLDAETNETDEAEEKNLLNSVSSGKEDEKL